VVLPLNVVYARQFALIRKSCLIITRTITMIKYLFILGFLLIIRPGYSQKFEWSKDGFNDRDGIFKNIDDTGIDLEISGIYAQRFNSNDRFVFTGINNGRQDGVYHNYQFRFSEKVDVEFTIQDINTDTIGPFRYYDFLVFSPSPAFSNHYSSINIKGDTILPNQGSSYSPEVKVKYKNIDSFSIQHGSGKTYNPGYIVISPIIINDNKMAKHKPRLVNNLFDNYCVIIGQNSPVNRVRFITVTGQTINVDFENRDSETAIIQTRQRLAAGIYFVVVEFNSGQVFKEKVLIAR
jgi:hypothetical protein